MWPTLYPEHKVVAKIVNEGTSQEGQPSQNLLRFSMFNYRVPNMASQSF